MVLTSTHNLNFIAKILHNLYSVYPCKLQLNYVKVGSRDSNLHGRVNVMILRACFQCVTKLQVTLMLCQ